MTVLAAFNVLEKSWLGQSIQSSLYIFPIIEVFHLIGLAVLGGAVLLVNFRLLGWGLTRHSVQKLASDVKPFQNASLALSLFSGFLLFASEAVKCYYHKTFWFKMAALAAALVFTYTVQKKTIASGANSGKLTAIVSILLWSGVGIGGRLIGFE
jgi:hypothetical protein